MRKTTHLNSRKKYAIMTVYSKIRWTWQPIFFYQLVRWGQRVTCLITLLRKDRQMQGWGLPPPNCRSIRLMHLTTYCCCIPSKVWTKCSLWATARAQPFGGPTGGRFTAKYPPKRRKGWFSRVVCRVRNLPFLSLTPLLQRIKGQIARSLIMSFMHYQL